MDKATLQPNAKPSSPKLEKEETALQQLQEFKAQGYLFHGSDNKDIEALEPRPPREVDPNKTFNSETAVFASNEPVSTILFGLIGSRQNIPPEIRQGTWWMRWPKDAPVKAIIPQKWKNWLQTATGSVYVLPPKTFTESDGAQFKSYEPVTPTTRIEVTFADYIQAGGRVEWYDEDDE